jgi:ATP-dependent Clp protease ATP-binding subunit ClpB
VLDEGRLTDNKGRIADFRNTIIIMTSNMGAHIIQEKFENIDMSKRMQIVEETKIEVMALLKKSIRPEFLNRIDELVMFTPLNIDEVKQIVEIQINSLKKYLKQKAIELNVSEAAIKYLSELGFDPQFGARPIKRVIQRKLLNQLSKEILSDRVNTNGGISIDFDGNRLVFDNDN